MRRRAAWSIAGAAAALVVVGMVVPDDPPAAEIVCEQAMQEWTVGGHYDEAGWAVCRGLPEGRMRSLAGRLLPRQGGAAPTAAPDDTDARMASCGLAMYALARGTYERTGWEACSGLTPEQRAQVRDYVQDHPDQGPTHSA